MLAVGGAMSGYSGAGRRNWAMPPTIRIMSDRTEAKIGRSMKKWEKRMMAYCAALFRLGDDLALLRHDLGAGPHHGVGEPVEHHLVVGFQALVHRAQALDQRPQRHRPRLHDFVVADHEHDLARL